MHGTGTLTLKNEQSFSGNWISDECAQHNPQILEAKAKWQEEVEKAREEEKKNVELTGERMLEDELAYKREHKPLAYMRKLKRLGRDDEARDCYQNSIAKYFAYVQGHLVPYMAELREQN